MLVRFSLQSRKQEGVSLQEQNVSNQLICSWIVEDCKKITNNVELINCVVERKFLNTRNMK